MERMKRMERIKTMKRLTLCDDIYKECTVEDHIFFDGIYKVWKVLDDFCIAVKKKDYVVRKVWGTGNEKHRPEQ